MTVKDWIKLGEAHHRDYGRVSIVGAKKGSKTMVDVMCIQRGKGWCEYTETYKRYLEQSVLRPDGSRSLFYAITQRDEYGMTDTVHIKTLKKC